MHGGDKEVESLSQEYLLKSMDQMSSENQMSCPLVQCLLYRSLFMAPALCFALAYCMQLLASSQASLISAAQTQ